MRYFFIVALLFFSFDSFSQTVITRPYARVPIKWIEKLSDYEWDTKNTKLKSPNPLIILSFEEITVIDGDTTKIFLNEIPETEEDSLVIEKKWYNSNDLSERECSVFLFYNKKDNQYVLRIIYQDNNEGFEYYMKPLRVDVIPYKRDLINY